MAIASFVQVFEFIARSIAFREEEENDICLDLFGFVGRKPRVLEGAFQGVKV